MELKIKNIKFEENKVNSIICTSDSERKNLFKLLSGINIDDFFLDSKNTVREQVNFYVGKKYKNNEKRIVQSLEILNLDKSFLDKEMSKLSSSEKQKSLLLTSIALNQKMVVLDGAFFDSKEQNNLLKIIREFKNEVKKTVLITSNNINFLHKISDYVYIIDNESVITYGKKYDVFTDFELLNKYNIDIPNVIKFSKMVFDKKGKKIGYRDDINDLLKDIYRNK